MTLLTFKTSDEFSEAFGHTSKAPRPQSRGYTSAFATRKPVTTQYPRRIALKELLTAPHPLRHCSRPKPFRTILHSDYMNKKKKKSLFTRYVKDSGQRAAFSNSSNTFFLADLSCVARICPPFSIIISSLGSDAFSYKICV